MKPISENRAMTYIPVLLIADQRDVVGCLAQYVPVAVTATSQLLQVSLLK